MYTDPRHAKIDEPGEVEGNVVFTYLDAFETDAGALDTLKARYRAGGVGDVAVKHHLIEVLERLLAPIRLRRQELARDPDLVPRVLREGTERGRALVRRTVSEVRYAMHLEYDMPYDRTTRLTG
jgi:tryptophanyl-tRNA synthetase